jgi:hypothetical protein
MELQYGRLQEICCVLIFMCMAVRQITIITRDQYSPSVPLETGTRFVTQEVTAIQKGEHSFPFLRMFSTSQTSTGWKSSV